MPRANKAQSSQVRRFRVSPREALHYTEASWRHESNAVHYCTSTFFHYSSPEAPVATRHLIHKRNCCRLRGSGALQYEPIHRILVQVALVVGTFTL